jgi:hypothetical protein
VKVDLKAFGELADTLFFMKQPEDAKLVSAAMRELEAHRARDVASGDLLAEFWRLDAERVRTIEAYNAELRHQRDRGIIARGGTLSRRCKPRPLLRMSRRRREHGHPDRQAERKEVGGASTCKRGGGPALLECLRPSRRDRVHAACLRGLGMHSP